MPASIFICFSGNWVGEHILGYIGGLDDLLPLRYTHEELRVALLYIVTVRSSNLSAAAIRLSHRLEAALLLAHARQGQAIRA